MSETTEMKGVVTFDDLAELNALLCAKVKEATTTDRPDETARWSRLAKMVAARMDYHKFYELLDKAHAAGALASHGIVGLWDDELREKEQR